jgi:predicted RNase H-like HicB family nuclease
MAAWWQVLGVILKAIIHDAEEGGYWAEAPALPGCVTQGESIEEVTANLREAIDGLLSAETLEAGQIGVSRVIELAV